MNPPNSFLDKINSRSPLTIPPVNRPEQRQAFWDDLANWIADTYGPGQKVRAQGIIAQSDMEKGMVAGIPGGVGSAIRGGGALVDAICGAVGGDHSRINQCDEAIN